MTRTRGGGGHSFIYTHGMAHITAHNPPPMIAHKQAHRMKSMAVTMPVMPPFAPVRRAASLLALAKSLHTSVTVVPSAAVTGGCSGPIFKQANK